MRSVQLQDEHMSLAQCISDAEAGETVTLLRGDKPVAQIIPFPNLPKPQRSQEERDASWQALLALMEKGIPMGGFKINSRDELYDRD